MLFCWRYKKVIYFVYSLGQTDLQNLVCIFWEIEFRRQFRLLLQVYNIWLFTWFIIYSARHPAFGLSRCECYRCICSLENSDDKSIYVCEACLWKNSVVIYTLSDKNDKMRKRHWSMRAFPCFVSFFLLSTTITAEVVFYEKSTKYKEFFSRKVSMFTRRNICMGMRKYQ